MGNKIMIGHGSGGKLTRKLIKDIFIPHISNRILEEENDSGIISVGNSKLAFSTDAFTVKPLFFPGGDIGKLAVCGTVNDLLVSGAKPRYLSATFVIEEGFTIDLLEKLIVSFSEQCKKAGVEVAAADTKVVEKGNCDGIYISVSGIGEIIPELDLSPTRITEGDQIIVTGNIGDHGAAILLARENLNIQTDISSDCACLQDLIGEITQAYPKAIKLMRDATRGGVATIINELASSAKADIKLMEKKLPVKEQVQMLCEMLGLNPLYLVNEGKIVIIVEKEYAKEVVSCLRKNSLGQNSAIIGEVTPGNTGRVVLETLTGGKRILDSLVEDQLPRIC